METVTPYEINVPDETIEEIKSRVAAFPWHEMPDDGVWEYGTNLDYMKEFCDYWVTKYDWRKQEARINEFANFMTSVDNINIHFIHERGSGPNPKPLIISHGWPGTIVEFLDFIDLLAHPENHGGSVEDAFDVVAPSLPGFGFSGRPPRPYGPRKMANIFNSLMTEVLGYDRYIAQGGDWGATICNWLAYDYSKSCKAIHINCLTMRHPEGPKNKKEIEWEKKFINDQTMQEGYRTIQATKPQSLSYSMHDSPVGVAAWILEKFYSWSDIKNNNIESVYTKDILLTNIMIYLITNTFNSASWIYFGRREEGGRNFPNNFKKINVPTGIAKFPKEMSEWPPKSYIERIFKIYQYSEMKRGGHFAALEQPDILVKDLRKFLRSLKYNPYSHNGRGGSL